MPYVGAVLMLGEWVDLSYSVNGQMYDFSLPGGEKIALSDLIEVLGILGDTYSGETATFDSADDFLKEVANVEFSGESLVKVTKNEEDNDWTLESLQPFDTEESLTITMKNGDVITVKVTDAQITTLFLSDSGKLYEVTVTYGEDAAIPDGAVLEILEFAKTSTEYQDAYKIVSQASAIKQRDSEEDFTEDKEEKQGDSEEIKNDNEDDTDLHFELNADVYHPMVVDGKLRNVKFSGDGLTITEMSSGDTELNTLTATNELKGGLEVRKNVTTTDDESDKVTSDTAFFTFKIKMQKSATEATPVFTTSEQFNPDGSTISGSLGFRIFASADIPEEATNVAEDKSSYEYNGNFFRANYNNNNVITGYTARGTIPSSGELTLKIRQSDTIRVVNVPAGTFYTVEEEAMPDGYELIEQSRASGSVPANMQALAEFWNKRTTFTIDLLKVDELDAKKVLADAEFKLFKEDGSTPATDADGNAIGTIKTGSDGKANIGKLLPGTYKLVETVAPDGYILTPSPITIIVTNDKVTFQQGLKQPMDAVRSGDGLTWTVTVTNYAGYELPATGGPGTRLFTILGSMLILGAGLMLQRKRKIG